MAKAIRRVRVRNFRGLQFLDLEVNGAGVKASGFNRQGKTSLLKAIRSLTNPKEVGPEAIRAGADEAEVFLDLGDVKVQRIFGRDGTNELEVLERDGKGWEPKGKPATVLKRLFGDSLLDPVELFLAKDREFRDLVLSALPCSVTPEQLQKWIPNLPADFDCTGHGLDVCARLHAKYYAERTVANATAEQASREAKRLRDAADEMPEPKTEVPSEADAHAAVDEAKRTIGALEERARAAAESQERSQRTRARIDDLRKRAATEVEGLTDPPPSDVTDAERLVTDWADHLRDLEAKLAKLQADIAEARKNHSDAELHLRTKRARAEQVASARQRSADMLRQAEELAGAIDLAAITTPSADEMSLAEEAHREALTELAAAEREAARQQAIRVAEAAEHQAEAAEAEANRLNRIVVALANDVPRELVAQSGGIPGLSIQGDAILIDGVDVRKGRSGQEQLEFAIEIARRANSRSRLLVCDGLERIDDRELSRFIELATKDGWQLFATRVENHDLVFEQIVAGGGHAEV